MRPIIATTIIILAAQTNAAEVTLVNDSTVVFKGSIQREDGIKLEEVLAANAGVTKIVLNSRGGDALESLNLMRLVIHYDLNTRVEDGALCASGCAFMWAMGKNRAIGSDNASVAFHGAHHAAVSGVDDDAMMFLTVGKYRSDTKFLQYFGSTMQAYLMAAGWYKAFGDVILYHTSHTAFLQTTDVKDLSRLYGGRDTPAYLLAQGATKEVMDSFSHLICEEDCIDPMYPAQETE